MSYWTIAAQDVRTGDQLNLGISFSKNPNLRWRDVKKIRRTTLPDGGDRIVITAGGCETWLHPQETVSIQRFD